VFGENKTLANLSQAPSFFQMLQEIGGQKFVANL